MKINMTKAKEIAHNARRIARAAEFAPWDIKATIPSEQAAAEAERQKIRDKYDELQVKIDKAKNVTELAKLLPNN
jgi:hypothetical protein